MVWWIGLKGPSKQEWKAVGQRLWQTVFKWKRIEKGVSGPSIQESLSKIDGPATPFVTDSIYADLIVTITYK